MSQFTWQYKHHAESFMRISEVCPEKFPTVTVMGMRSDGQAFTASEIVRGELTPQAWERARELAYEELDRAGGISDALVCR